MLPVPLGPCRDRGGIRAGVGLGQREGRNRLAARQRRKPAVLLSLRPREEDGVAPQPLDGEQALGRRARPGQLLADETEGDRPERPLEAAPVGHRHEQREQALLAEGPREIPVELVALAACLGHRVEDLGARPAHGGPEGVLGRREVEDAGTPPVFLAKRRRHGDRYRGRRPIRGGEDSLPWGRLTARPSTST